MIINPIQQSQSPLNGISQREIEIFILQQQRREKLQGDSKTNQGHRYTYKDEDEDSIDNCSSPYEMCPLCRLLLCLCCVFV